MGDLADPRALLRQALTSAGQGAKQAEDLAELCFAALEGALMLARVDRTTAPLDRVERHLRTLVT